MPGEMNGTRGAMVCVHVNMAEEITPAATACTHKKNNVGKGARGGNGMPFIMVWYAVHREWRQVATGYTQEYTLMIMPG